MTAFAATGKGNTHKPIANGAAKIQAQHRETLGRNIWNTVNWKTMLQSTNPTSAPKTECSLAAVGALSAKAY
jgi:hypothetical protein